MHRQQRRRATPLHNWIRTLLTLALLACFAAPAWAAPASPATLPCAEVDWDPATGWPATLRGCQPEAARDNSPAGRASAFLKTYHAAFGLDKELGNLRLLSARHGLASSHVVYQQVMAGQPVYGAYLSVHFDREGQIQVMHNRTLPGLQVETLDPKVSAVEAVQQARTAIQFGAPRASSPAPELVVVPMAGDQGRLAWRVMILAAQPAGDWEVLLDATTGKVIKRYNRLVFARGRILDVAAAQPSLPARAGSLPLRTLPLHGLDDSGWLRGKYVDVTYPVGYQPATAFSTSGDFLYQADDPRFKEVMVYHHIDAAQRYIQSLGYSNRNDPSNGIRERVTHASPHWFAQDQSFYSASDDALHFGDGGWPDALDPDIIVHEYGHALLHDLAPHWGGGDMEAVGEGFGDYLAASMFAEISADPACIGEWDSQGLAGGFNRCLRRVDRERQYPHDLTGDAHADGEIWSRVLWDVRGAAGREAADKLALESSFYLPPAASLVEAGQALLNADAALFDGQFRAVIVGALQSRGLMPLSAPVLTSPIGGKTLTPGGQLAAAWQMETNTLDAAGVAQPISYDLQWSLNAGEVGVRRYGFGAGMPTDFSFAGHAAWLARDGAARSGLIDHGQRSSLVLPVETVADGQVSFRYQLDSEQGFDHFEFLVDGEVFLRASGQAEWRDFDAALPAGQHELEWRYSKDNTLSSGEDAVWIDDIQIEQASLAEWQSAEIDPVRPAGGDALVRVPDSASSAASLRVRARVGAVASPWVASDLLTIDQPTAVNLATFEAGIAQNLAGWMLPWGLAGALAGLALFAGLRRRAVRRQG